MIECSKIDYERLWQKSIAEKMGFKSNPAPVFETVYFAEYEYGSKYIDGYYKFEDVQNASQKFQEMLKKYQKLAFDTNTNFYGPSWKMARSYKKLIKQGTKENIYYYSPKEYDRIMENYFNNEEARLDEWFANHPQAAKMAKEKMYPAKSVQDTDNYKLDDIYDKVMEEAGLEK